MITLPRQYSHTISQNDIRSHILTLPRWKRETRSLIPSDTASLLVAFPPHIAPKLYYLNRGRGHICGITGVLKFLGVDKPTEARWEFREPGVAIEIRVASTCVSHPENVPGDENSQARVSVIGVQPYLEQSSPLMTAISSDLTGESLALIRHARAYQAAQRSLRLERDYLNQHIRLDLEAGREIVSALATSDDTDALQLAKDLLSVPPREGPFRRIFVELRKAGSISIEDLSIKVGLRPGVVRRNLMAMGTHVEVRDRQATDRGTEGFPKWSQKRTKDVLSTLRAWVGAHGAMWFTQADVGLNSRVLGKFRAQGLIVRHEEEPGLWLPDLAAICAFGEEHS